MACVPQAARYHAAPRPGWTPHASAGRKDVGVPTVDHRSSEGRSDHDALSRALLGAFEQLARTLGAWTVRRADRMVLAPHRYPVTVDLAPLTHPDGLPALSVTSRIVLARAVPPERYLALLARHARREDALALLVLEPDGRLTSVRQHLLAADPDGPSRIEEIVEAVAIQSLQAEFLVRESEFDALLGPEHVPTRPAPGPVTRRRPDRLLSLAYRISRSSVRRLATVGLTGESQLGPWFVGTEQDAILEERMRAGWRREPDPARHLVVVHAPDDEPVLHQIRVAWAHHSSLMGPSVLLAATTRGRLGPRPGMRLSALNRAGDAGWDRGRVGLWMPESWLDPDRLADVADGPWRTDRARTAEIEHDRATWVTVAPTAWARPGALARLWRWAEHEAVRAFQPRALN